MTHPRTVAARIGELADQFAVAREKSQRLYATLARERREMTDQEESAEKIRLGAMELILSERRRLSELPPTSPYVPDDDDSDSSSDD